MTGEGRRIARTYLLSGTNGDFARLFRPHGEITAVRWVGTEYRGWRQEDYPPPRRGRARKRPFIRPPERARAWVTVLATAEGWRELHARFCIDQPEPTVRPRMRGPGVLWTCLHEDFPNEPVICRAPDEAAAKTEACRVWGLNPDASRLHYICGVDQTRPERDLIVARPVGEKLAPVTSGSECP